jgi:hypothetical protein
LQAEAPHTHIHTHMRTYAHARHLQGRGRSTRAQSKGSAERNLLSASLDISLAFEVQFAAMLCGGLMMGRGKGSRTGVRAQRACSTDSRSAVRRKACQPGAHRRTRQRLTWRGELERAPGAPQRRRGARASSPQPRLRRHRRDSSQTARLFVRRPWLRTESVCVCPRVAQAIGAQSALRFAKTETGRAGTRYKHIIYPGDVALFATNRLPRTLL